MTETDYRTYPGDRHTRHTLAQRKRKLGNARVSAELARLELKELCDDYSANGYRLTEPERAEWRDAARMCDALRDVLA